MNTPLESLKPVYYIYGTDDYLCEEALNGVKSKALSGPFASMNYQAFEGKSLEASDVVAAASTLPAFADKRVVLIKGAETMKAQAEKELMEYIKNPSPSTCLILAANAGKIEKTSAFFKLLGEKGYIKACNRLPDRELLGWIKKEAKAQGKAITDGAAGKLLNIAGNRLRDIKGELDKIILFAGDKDRIDERDVEDSGVDLREETIFSLSEAIGEKDARKALRIFTKLSNEEPLKVLGAISRQVRVLLKLKALLRKKVPPSQAASSVGVPEFFLDKYLKSCRHFTERELKAAIGKLSGADLDLKTGRIPEPLVLPKLIVELCEAIIS